MQNKRILTGIMTFILLMSCSLSSYAITTQLLKNYDYLGGGVVYRYDKDTKTVTISKELSGNGATSRYAESPFEGSDIESVVINDGVKELTMNLFCKAKKLKSVTITNSVTLIGRSTFEDCESLTNINIPDSVKNIEYQAFKGCTNLKSIKIPSNVEELGQYVFYQCSKLESVVIENGTKLTVIPHGAFQECTELSKISIANGITDLNGRAFEDCKYLTDIALPDTVTNVSQSAFRNCVRLKTVNLSQNLENVDDSAFRGCVELSDINIPTSLKTIGNYAFSDCKNLSDITIPAQTDSIGTAAFKDCGNIYVDESNNNFICDDLILYSTDKSRLLHCSTNYCEEYKSPETVTDIDAYAFSSCSLLKKVDLSILKINQLSEGIFNNCTSLENAIIPNGVEKIKSYAFYNAQSLESVIIPESVTNIDIRVFNNNNVLGKFITDDESKVNIGSLNDKNSIIFNWKAVTLGKTTDVDDTSITFSLNVDETNQIDELKYEIGEYDKQYFALGGQSVENKEIKIPQGTEKVSIYSRDIAGNETVNICDVPNFDLPTADDITYGQTLGDSELTVSGVNSIDGVWVWRDPDIMPVAGTNPYTVIFIPEDTQNYNSITAEIFITVNKAVPEYTIPTDLTAVYSPNLTLADIELPDGWTWVESNTPLSASEKTYSAIFTPLDTENYKSITADVTVTVSKAVPEYTVPTDLTAVYSPNLTLADIELPDGFSWNEPDTKLCVPGGEYKATYTPNDIDNYTTVELTLNVEIKKYTPIIGVDIQLPTASDITYGQKLGDSVLTPSENDVIDGEWLWEESDVTPSDDDNSYNAIFVVDDENYETVYVEVPVKVKETSSNKPSNSGSSSSKGHSHKQTSIENKSDKVDEVANNDVTDNVVADNDVAITVAEYDVPYISGYEDNTFRPNEKITRAEAITAIVRAKQFAIKENVKPSFWDISSHWAKSYIDTAADLKIADGYEDKMFKPDNYITRAEFAKIIAVLIGENVQNKSSNFADTKNHWAENYIAVLSEKEIIKGYDNNMYKPDKPITRAEAVTIINKAVSRNCKSDIKINFTDVQKTHWAYDEILKAAGK